MREDLLRNVVDGIRRLDPRTVPADDVTVGEDGVLAAGLADLQGAAGFADHGIEMAGQAAYVVAQLHGIENAP